MKNKGCAIALGLMAISAFVVIGIIMKFVGVYNYGNTAENGIKSSYEDLQQTLGQYSLKVIEIAQVPDSKKNDLVELYSEVMAGRYGEDGSKATFQWLQEQNPDIGDNLYTKIQQVMEAGRNEFQNKQTIFISRKQAYNTALGSIPDGFILQFMGYPKIDIDSFKTVQSQHSKESFETGIDEGIKLQ